MHINEVKISHLDNKPVKFKGIIYPIPIKENIQAPFYCAIACGLRGSGKTYAIVKMLQNAEKSGFIEPRTGEKCAIRHILFSPTIHGNPIFNTLKYLDEDDIHNDYSEAKLQEVLDELQADREETDERLRYIDAYNKFSKMSKKEFEKWRDVESILMLEQYDFANPRELPPIKYPNGCITNIILDDCLSNKEAFSSKKVSVLNKLVLNGRHYKANAIIASQNLKAINKSIRINTQVWMLFRTKSMKVLMDDIYPEVSNILTEDEFLQIYEKATQNENDFLCIDEKDKKENRFKRNFDVILKIE